MVGSSTGFPINAAPTRKLQARPPERLPGLRRVAAMVDPAVPALREAARHRGYQLLVSKKHTTDVGDYGKFGLADAEGKPLLGMGTDGLTASAEEIESYLRAAAVRKPKPAPKPRPEPPPLRLRKAEASDAGAIARLLAPRVRTKAPELAERMAHLAKGGGMIVAEQGAVIGCIAWTLVPALHRAPCGRIATLVVAEKRRREGIGKALVEEAAQRLAKAGCESIEATSDIDIRSNHGFFRKIGFEETSYRFARTIAAK